MKTRLDARKVRVGPFKTQVVLVHQTWVERPYRTICKHTMEFEEWDNSGWVDTTTAMLSESSRRD